MVTVTEMLAPKVSSPTLVELLCSRASPSNPERHRTVFTFMERGKAGRYSLDFAALDRAARQVAVRLQVCTRPGDRVLIACPSGADFVVGFWGCVYAGVIAVPSPTPSGRSGLPRLQRIVEDAEPVVFMTTRAVEQRVRAMANAPFLGRIANWLCLDDGADADADRWALPRAAPSDTVFLQYTSGSTAAPKGVMVSHANILANLDLSRVAYRTQPTDTCVTWLPLYHDFGLIGTVLFPVYLGFHSVQFEPAAVLAHPYRWLKAMSDFRAQLTGAPDFAYALCAEKVTEEQKRSLDLSSLEVAVNGAERVRQRTLQRFADAFAGCGLRKDVLTPAYGLAECVLFVAAARPPQGTGPAVDALDRLALARGRAERPSQGSADAVQIACVGAVRGDGGHEVVIVDPEGAPCRDGQVGEIWVRGPSVATGYWNKPELSASTFNAVLQDGRGGFLRTGDLGYAQQGRLHVTGRMKELIVLKGRNLYPQDLEATLERVDPAFRPAGCAVFAIEDDEAAQLVAVQELDFRKSANTGGLAERACAALAEHNDISELQALWLVRPGALPRTSSGKIQRLLCRQWYAEGKLEPVWTWRRDAEAQIAAPAACETPTEQAVVDLCAELMGGVPVSVTSNFFSHLGGNSLLATQIVSRLREAFGVDVPLRTLFAADDLRALAREVDRLCTSAAPGGDLPPPSAPPMGPLWASSAQQRLWLLEQLHPGDSYYNIPVAVRLTGPLQAEALRRGVDTIIARHEALRTRFSTDNERLVQQVAAPWHVDMPTTDLSALPADVQSERVQRIAAEEAARVFDLRSGPLLRASLLKLGEDAHVFLLTLHHIVADLWSMGVFLRELSALYGAHAADAPVPLAPLPIQYPQHAHWQREQADSPTLQQQLAYWTRKLGGELPLLNLPTDRPRPAVPTHRGESLHFALDPQVVSRLRQLGAQHGATLYMVMLAAFKVLLHRWTDQDEVVLGSPIANRNRAEVEGLIGFFVNTLVLRSRLAGNPSFSRLLGQVRDDALDAYANQDLPFDRLVTALQPERQTTYTPLFRVMFALQNAPSSDLQLPGLQLDLLHTRHGSAKFDLTLFLWESREGLRGEIEYSVDLFERATMERMASHFNVLLRSIADEPQARLLDLPMIDAAEQARLVQVQSRSSAATVSGSTIPALFRDQAARSPDATALVQDGRSLTYAELQDRSERLARRFAALGVAPGSKVALCLGRSLKTVVAFLAVLKAGAAYVPLDPSYPAQRLAFMLEDSGAMLLVSDTEFARALPPHGLQTVWLDQAALEPTAGQAAEAAELPQAIHPDQLAYVNYTSGSTGRPKGVAVTHRGVVRLVKDNPYGDFHPGAVFLHMAATAFDATTFELWGALCNGASVAIASAVKLSIPDLAKVFREGGVTTAFLTSSLFDLMLNEDPGVFFHGARRILVGGEAVRLASFRKAVATLPHCRFSNNYGPTETTTFASNFDGALLSPEATSVPIGRPIGNTEFYVLDRRMNLVPVGLPGELYLGGTGLAQGYLNLPGLTAERFCPHPFSTVAGARLYKTGDLVRWLLDGHIDFIGRLDHQVKVRGFRIELGEIEHVLCAHPGVKTALALARQDEPGDKVLTAYVVPSSVGNAESADRQVSQWQSLYDDEVYAASVAEADAEAGDFNVAGWNSSYTGEPIDPAEMREWQDATVARIRAFDAKRIWEIGCGSGLLLLRLAPTAAHYRGSDFSAPALAYVDRQLKAPERPKVLLEQRLADNFDGIEVRSFDQIVLNSIVQYFPSLDYLLTVIEGAVEAVADGGTVFIGDVRHLGLLQAFHTSVQLHKEGAGDATAGRLRERVRRQVALENELVLAPALFHSIGRRFPRVTRVEVLHKRGAARNELSLYRYDVVLHIGAGYQALAEVAWTDWQSAFGQVDRLVERLRSQRPVALAVASVPNARVLRDHLAAVRLADLPEHARLADLPPASEADEGVDPEALAQAAESLGYRVELRCAGTGLEHCFDVVFADARAASGAVWVEPQGGPAVDSLPEPWTSLANDPLIGKATETLLPELRAWVHERLPEHAQPSHLVLLDRLPLNANGKVDVLRLPSPRAVLNNPGRPHVPPRSVTERAVAEMWAQLLRIERISVKDNFFELGGHSLLASQGLSRIRERFSVELSLKQCFLHPTVESLSTLIDNSATVAQAPRIKRLPRRAAA